MNNGEKLLFSAVIICMYLITAASADTLYVSTNGLHQTPFTNWMIAARTIQDAVDAATDGDMILVSNGIYNLGGREAGGEHVLTNRVIIDKPITLQAVGGPEHTIIMGSKDPSSDGYGDAAVRGVWMVDGSIIVGFTIEGGSTRTSIGADDNAYGSGAFCQSTNAVISNCVLKGNSAAGIGGGSYGGTLIHCAITSNRASYGGGVYGSAVLASAFDGNWASDGLYGSNGGGADGSVLQNCMLSGNRADYGGAASESTLCNCFLSGNTAFLGGGSYECTLNNCTVVGNSAEYDGGSHGDRLYNCIVYYNDAPSGPNHGGSTFEHSCSAPLPSGPGNISREPGLASASHLALASPCKGAGSSLYASGYDIDREPWLSPPSMGCDELHIGSITGALNVSIWASYTNVAVGIPVQFRADAVGRTTASVWEWGDGVVSSNQVYAEHVFTSTADYEVVFRVYNESKPSGVAAGVSVHVASRMVHYVNLNSETPSAPFESWETAATNIQDAIDAVSQIGALVLVTNGIYATGGRMIYGALTNRVVVIKRITLQSVNGPAVTVIQGAHDPFTTNGNSAVRCAYLGAHAIMSGFTLTNGSTRTEGDYPSDYRGGGVWCEAGSIVSNCIVAGNTAYFDGGCDGGTINDCLLTGNMALGGLVGWFGGGGSGGGTLNRCILSENYSGDQGGGALYGTLNNCLLVHNSARTGGGAYLCSLNNCTVVGNTASSEGGGVYDGELNNCIVYSNAAPTGSNHNDSVFIRINNSCTIPALAACSNITSDPKLTDQFELTANSPCIDAGVNQEGMAETRDLAGVSRIINGKVDMGAYEFHYNATLQAFLQGPYCTTLHTMKVILPSNMPFSAPYAGDPRAVLQIPSNVTDWVLLEMRSDPSNSAIFSESAFLRNDGRIINAAGETNIIIEVSPGTTNYLVISHRNHLSAMSAQPIVFTNQAVQYSFTTGSGQYYGGTNAAAQLEPGVWGMMAGDADGDGKITAADRSICESQRAQAGYLAGDFTLDGVVTDED